MADPTIIELIELRAKGIADILQQIDRLKDSIGKTSDAQVVYAKALQDPVYQKNLRTLEQMKLANRDLYKLEQQRAQLAYKQQQGVNNVNNRARAYEELKIKQATLAAERDIQRLQMAASTFRANSRLGMSDAVSKLQFLKEQEAAQRAIAKNDLAAAGQRANSFAGLEDARAMVDMRNREEQVKRLLQRNELAAKIETSGTPQAVRDARERLEIERKVEQLRKAEERTMSLAKYGRAGSVIMGGLQSSGARLAGGLATAGAAGVGAAAMAGFSDTVEMHTFRTQLMYLNREVAGAFRPALMEATAGLKILRYGMESMSGSQQKLLAATTMTILGLGALNLMLNRTTGMGLIGWGGRGMAAMNASRAASSMGQFGAFAGAVGPSAAAGAGASAGSAGLGALPIAGIAAGLALAGFNTYQLGARGANEFQQGNRSEGYKSLFGGLNSLNPMMAPLELARRNLTPGYNPSWAAFTSPLGMLGEAGYQSIFGKGIFSPPPGAGVGVGADRAAAGKRSRVTPMLPTLYSEAGGTYEEVALAVANKAAADRGDGESELEGILKWLRKRFGDEQPPNNPPP